MYLVVLALLLLLVVFIPRVLVRLLPRLEIVDLISVGILGLKECVLECMLNTFFLFFVGC